MKHTIDSCLASAKGYSTRAEWKRGNNQSYQAAMRKGWLDECCAHMIAAKVGPKFGQRNYTTAQWVELARSKFGDTYDYSTVAYVDSKTKVAIGCRDHGEFMQAPFSHLQGVGCPQCGIAKQAESRSSTTEAFVTKARTRHGDKYDYSNTHYVKRKERVEIICREHGSFWQTPDDHVVAGAGCQKCNGGIAQTADEFIVKAQQAHGDKYDYSKVKYTGAMKSVEIVCSAHGSFFQTPSQHLLSNCPKCAGAGPSIPETEVFEFIKSICPDAEQSVTGELSGRNELDILVRSKNLAVEFNGLIWHSAKFGKGRDYHQKKTDEAHKVGIRLIHIWEDEWRDKRDWCKAFLRMQLSGPDKVIGARKCELRKIGAPEACEFHRAYHLQGAGGGEHLGFFYQEELVAVATVRGNELARWCVKFGLVVVGGLSKAVKWFGRDIVSYCDTAKHDGKGYIAAGFTLAKTGDCSYFYTDGKKRLNRVMMQKHKLAGREGVSGNTEKEMAASLGMYQIGGCRQLRFEYHHLPMV